MTFKRRVYLFSIGFVLGVIASYFLLFRGRTSHFFFTPTGQVLSHIRKTKISIDSSQLCKLNCLHISADSLKKMIVNSGDIVFSKSKKKRRPCPGYYIILGEDANQFHINITMCDSTSEITYIDTEKQSCDCR